MLIPELAQNGAAIATVAAEVCVTITQLLIARKIIPFKIIDKQVFYCLITTILMVIICFVFINIGCSDIINLVTVPIIGALFYGLIMIFTKNQLAVEVLMTVTNKIKK